MNILYCDDHAIAEFDHLQLLTDLGYDCFSLGAYHNLGHPDLPRPAVKGLVFHPDLDEVYLRDPNKNHIQDELIEWADLILIINSPSVMATNWPRIKCKPVIWRTTGQSTRSVEARMKPLRDEGMKIVRYSPKEQNIPGYIGHDAIIRFYKDPDIYQGWTGEDASVVNFSQSLKGRRDFCHYNEIMSIIEKFNGKVYGSGNEDLDQYCGGFVSYERQLELLQKSRVTPYGGTWPACYTLSFMEALMVGLPIVSISKKLAHYDRYEPLDFFECDELLSQIDGLVCDTVEQMIEKTELILNDNGAAAHMAMKQRELAIEVFGKETIQKQWKELIDEVGAGK